MLTSASLRVYVRTKYSLNVKAKADVLDTSEREIPTGLECHCSHSNPAYDTWWHCAPLLLGRKPRIKYVSLSAEADQVKTQL